MPPQMTRMYGREPDQQPACASPRTRRRRLSGGLRGTLPVSRSPTCPAGSAGPVLSPAYRQYVSTRDARAHADAVGYSKAENHEHFRFPGSEGESVGFAGESDAPASRTSIRRVLGSPVRRLAPRRVSTGASRAPAWVPPPCPGVAQVESSGGPHSRRRSGAVRCPCQQALSSRNRLMTRESCASSARATRSPAV